MLVTRARSARTRYHALLFFPYFFPDFTCVYVVCLGVKREDGRGGVGGGRMMSSVGR